MIEMLDIKDFLVIIANRYGSCKAVQCVGLYPLDMTKDEARKKTASKIFRKIWRR
ncbi:MAG: hypothetical protein KAW12_17220 [Candidatus Aminicenantes bacterium]|nr:hypothetical protein [Candidatus Aminicenantes bacterium]